MLDFENSTDMRALSSAELDHVAGGLSVSSITVPAGIMPAGFTMDNVDSVNLSYNSATGYTTVSLNLLEYAETSGKMSYASGQNSTFHAGVTAGSQQTTTTTTTAWSINCSIMPDFTISISGQSVSFSGVGCTGVRSGSTTTTTASKIPAPPAPPAGGTPEKPKYGGKPSKK
jgi:hypothetical protein